MEKSSAAQNHEVRPGKAELLARIDQSSVELEKTLHGLNEHQLMTPGPEKWAVKDHLMHLAVWELGIAELLQHRDRFAAMQVDEALVRSKSEDEVNEIIYMHYKDLTWVETNTLFQSAHRQFLNALDALTDEDLYRPYANYVSGGRGPQGPVIGWIAGNTYAHYDLHNQYIKSLLQSIS